MTLSRPFKCFFKWRMSDFYFITEFKKYLRGCTSDKVFGFQIFFLPKSNDTAD